MALLLPIIFFSFCLNLAIDLEWTRIPIPSLSGQFHVQLVEHDIAQEWGKVAAPGENHNCCPKIAFRGSGLVLELLPAVSLCL